MWSWHVAVPASGPWARPLIIIEHDPQIPSRQSWSNAIAFASLRHQAVVDHVEHLEERHLGADVGGVDGLERTLVVRANLAPHPQLQVHYL